MNTERQRRRRPRRRLAWIAAAIAFACSGDAHVGCSPSLTCSLRASRFAPAVPVDAGPERCDQTQSTCPAAQLSAGGKHACVITDSRDLLCWGDRTEGQRGRDLDEASGSQGSASAVDAGAYVYGFSRVFGGVRLVSAGFAHSCAVLDNGWTECWGRGHEGQVDGDVDREANDEPAVVAVADVLALSAGGDHTCAATLQGVMCWGANQYGQSGRDLANTSALPQLVRGTEGATQVACGARHSCALLTGGRVTCWGELIDDAGQPAVTAEATLVVGLEAVLQISAGGGHSCALTPDAVLCWGHNETGQLGDGTTRSRATPAVVSDLDPGAGFVAAGGGDIDGHLVGHACVVDRASHVSCWGHNDHGQLGIGVSPDQTLPKPVMRSTFDGTDTLQDIARVALGAAYSCALGSRGAVFCWGDDGSGQLGYRVDPEMERQPSPGDAVRVQRFGRSR